MLKKIIIILFVLFLLAAVGYGVFNFKTTNNNEIQKDDKIHVEGLKPIGRIDILNYGKDSNDIEVLKTMPSDMTSLKYDNVQFRTFLFLAKPEWQKGEIQFKTKGDGSLTVTLMGNFKPDENGNAKKILIDYKNVILNEEKVFTDTKTLWHDERENYFTAAPDGKIYTLKFEYKIP